MTKALKQLLQGKEGYIASANEKGVPHLTIGRAEALSEDRLDVSGWFCPRTLANPEANPSVSVTVRAGHEGYQLVGIVEEKTIDAVTDGYYSEEASGVPQARYHLVVRVDRAMEMGDRPHSDKGIPADGEARER